MTSHPKKLNLLQRGVGQGMFTALVALFCCVVAGLVLYWLDKARLRAADITVFDIIVVAALFTAISIAVLRFSTRLNLALSVILPRAVEFSSALRKLGILELKEQITFARKHKLAVFITDTPILGDERENARARIYPFVNNPLASEGVFTTNIGKRTLCLDAEEYERIADELKERGSLTESAAIATKDEEIKSLRTALAAAMQENRGLVQDRDELRGRVQMQPAQEEGRVDRLRIERLQWAALTPAIEKLLKEAPQGKKYTTPEIEAAFADEWERRADLRERMRQLTGSEETKPSESLMAAVKAEFKDAGMLSPGGRPRKNL